MNILGVSIHRRGSAACLVRDGAVVACAREEWFTRVMGDTAFPEQAVAFCLDRAELAPEDVDVVAHGNGSPGRRSVGPSWLAPLAHIPARTPLRLGSGLRGETALVKDAHAAAASAFFPGPFEQAAILVVNGPETEPACVFAHGEGRRIQILDHTSSPHTAGTIFSAFAHRLGLKEPWTEEVLMDLAPLGRPRFYDVIRRSLVEFGDDGFCRVNGALVGDGTLNGLYGRVFALVGERTPSQGRGIRDMDLARSVEVVFEEALLHAARRLHRLTGARRLVFGGEAALDPVAAGRLVREGPFEEVWVPPSPADTALGCALHVWHQVLERERPRPALDCYIGPSFTDEAIGSYIEEAGIVFERLDDEGLCRRLAEVLAHGALVGWLQGAMACGPHGLGARCILADPRIEDMRRRLNETVKRRGAFRMPGASFLEAHAAEYLNDSRPSPYMLLSVPLSREHARPLRHRERKIRGIERLSIDRSDVPAVTGADRSARVHTVGRAREPLLHRLIEHFHDLTGCPLLLNDSLSVEGEPIAASPRDAYECFMRTGLHYLAMGPYLIDKRRQPLWDENSDVQ